jgi:hypothetical protein
VTAHRPLDLERVIGEVAARHKILLKPDDPAFALATINRLVLEDVVTDLLEKVRVIISEFEQAAGQVQTMAGGLIAREVKEATASIRGDLGQDIAVAGKRTLELVDAIHRAHSRSAREKWVAIGAACALIVFFCGIVVGRLLK